MLSKKLLCIAALASLVSAPLAIMAHTSHHVTLHAKLVKASHTYGDIPTGGNSPFGPKV